MVARMCLLVWLWIAKVLFGVWEQPVHSVQERHPRFEEIKDAIHVLKETVLMGYYGALTRKPVWLYGFNCSLRNIHDYRTTPLPTRTSNLTTSHIDNDGRKRFSGTKALKGSQTYPKDFGVALNKIYRQHEEGLKKKVRFIRDLASTQVVDIGDLFTWDFHGDWRQKDIIFFVILRLSRMSVGRV
jgi:hypothetical protein